MNPSLQSRYAVAFLAVTLSPSTALSQTPTVPALKQHRVSVFAGSLLVPEACASRQLSGNVDVFMGQLEGSCPAIQFIAGHPLTAVPTADQRHRYAEFHEERLGEDVLRYGVRAKDSTFILEAHIGMVNFTFSSPSRAAFAEVLSLLRTFVPGNQYPWPKPKSAA